jgi:hypothetical protein
VVTFNEVGLAATGIAAPKAASWATDEYSVAARFDDGSGTADLGYAPPPLGVEEDNARVGCKSFAVPDPSAMQRRTTVSKRSGSRTLTRSGRDDLAVHLQAATPAIGCDPAWKSDPLRRGIGVQN